MGDAMVRLCNVDADPARRDPSKFLLTWNMMFTPLISNFVFRPSQAADDIRSHVQKIKAKTGIYVGGAKSTRATLVVPDGVDGMGVPKTKQRNICDEWVVENSIVTQQFYSHRATTVIL